MYGWEHVLCSKICGKPVRRDALDIQVSLCSFRSASHIEWPQQVGNTARHKRQKREFGALGGICSLTVVPSFSQIELTMAPPCSAAFPPFCSNVDNAHSTALLKRVAYLNKKERRSEKTKVVTGSFHQVQTHCSSGSCSSPSATMQWNRHQSPPLSRNQPWLLLILRSR